MNAKVTHSIEEASERLLNGDVIVFPTETVYGLGALLNDEKAINKIYEIKDRKREKPLSIHLARKEQIKDFCLGINSLAESAIEKFLPGPVTLILKKNNKVPSYITSGLDTVGIRVPDCEITQKLIEKLRIPIVGTSANLSGMPSPVSLQESLKNLGAHVDLFLSDTTMTTRYKKESTIIDCTGESIRILREGALKLP